MKKLIFTLSFLASASFLFAGAGIFETYMGFSLNGGGEFYKGSGGGNPAFASSVLAMNLNPNTNTLVLKTRGINTFEDFGSAVLSATISYRVYLQGSPAPAYIVLPLSKNGPKSGNNQNWQENAPLNLLAGVGSAGTYIVEIQFDGVTNGAGGASNPISRDARLLGSQATFTTNAVLANELTFFNAAKQGNKVNLNWLTASEKANDNFSIERSKDGKNFTAIGQLKGAMNSSVSKEYAFTDVSPFKGINYYRLKSTEVAGKVTYSGVVSVSVMDKVGKTFVYPNPVAEASLRLEHEAVTDGDLQIRVMDISGRVLQTEKRTVINGNNVISLDINHLSSGQYLIAVDEQLVRFVKN